MRKIVMLVFIIMMMAVMFYCNSTGGNQGRFICFSYTLRGILYF